MENNKVTSNIHRYEIWTIAVLVTIFTWMVVITMVSTFWDEICAKIAITALEYGMEQTLTPRYGSAIPPMQNRRPASRRPSAPRLKTHDEKMEEFKASLERVAPTKTAEEWIEEMDRDIRKLTDRLSKDSDVNE